MKIIFLLVGASILVASGFLIAFLWAVRNGQYDDVYTPSVRILFDDEPPQEPAEDETKINQ
jgi:cbb3-type cytochrome oxidase maturation protein